MRETKLTDNNSTHNWIEDQLFEVTEKGDSKSYTRFILAALGSLPWVGGFLGAIAAKDSETEQKEVNSLQQLWIQEHERKIKNLGHTLYQILSRLKSFDEDIKNRIESPEYLNLIRKGFRSWDQSDTEEKRELIRRLLTNAGATKLCSDELIRLFIDWIETYHEAHFKVIREIYRTPNISRGSIWDNINKSRPRENSAEADLFKYLIRDLSMGGVIRQKRAVDNNGQFMKNQRKKRAVQTKIMESAFEEEKPYILTELGKQFVHYTMEEVVPQVE